MLADFASKWVQQHMDDARKMGKPLGEWAGLGMYNRGARWGGVGGGGWAGWGRAGLVGEALAGR